MSEWTSRTLIDVAVDLPSAIVDGPFGSNLKLSDYVEDGIPVLQGNNITNDRFEWRDVRFISKHKAIQLIRSAVREGDLLIVKIGSVGYAAILTSLHGYEYGIIPANLLKATFDAAIVDTKFVYYQLTCENGKKLLRDIASNTAQPALSLRSFKGIKLRFPSLSEQHRIAEILSTLDEAIEQTEALIAKHQQIKAGLMHDLFTRGITPDGHLRPTREQAPDLYKESPLGWMPKDWGCDYLQNLTLKIVDGVHHTPSYVEHGVPFVTIKNLTASQGIDFKELSYVTLADHHEFLKRADPKPGDVLVTKDGTLGVSRIVEPFHPEFSIFVSVAQLRPIATRLRPQMLHSFFDSGFYEQQMGGLSAGSGLKHIHLAHFRRFQIPLPSPNEQDRIAAITFATNERLASEMLLLAKLRQQKHGLMHDLLTGCVRIPAVKAKEVSTIVHTSSDLEPNT